MLTQCWLNVGSASRMLCRHQASIRFYFVGKPARFKNFPIMEQGYILTGGRHRARKCLENIRDAHALPLKDDVWARLYMT